jgi:hypothetical protein
MRSTIELRPYQAAVYEDHETGILVLHWARQTGKTFTLAVWAVDRLLCQLRVHRDWLVTVLSNSRENGAEFVAKCAQVARSLGLTEEDSSGGASPPVNRRGGGGRAFHAWFAVQDQSIDVRAENLRFEVRIALVEPRGVRLGRIKVLAANPRTVRGFSGDLILDEFAFHQDSAAIWEAAEPILSANKEFLCRIASTGNGKGNLFYRMATGGSSPSRGSAARMPGGKVSPFTIR